MTKPYYITTAIDYPNALPHVGTAFEKVGADAQARFQRACGRKVRFLMGNDENTQKVAGAAAKLGETSVQRYADVMAGEFRKVWKLLDVIPSEFGQTSSKVHYDFCRRFAQTVYDNGFIYKKDYEGWYCDECEEYKVEGKCESHPEAKIEKRGESNYFFAQSRYRDAILHLYKSGNLIVAPEHRQVELLNFIRADLKDISISRQNQGWGIPVPWDESQVLYVWFDALLNYLTWADGCWPADVHVIGKDIVRFHGALLPAMLLAHGGFPLPRLIYSHGFVYAKTDSGVKKFSKSGVSLNPCSLVDVFGPDAYRYFFLKTCNFADDGLYDFSQFAETYNADLVNKYGNLFSRVCRLALQKLGGKIPAGPAALPLKSVARWCVHMELFEYRDALLLCLDGIDECNRLLDDKKPWAEGATDVPETLARCAATLKTVSFLFSPVMPRSSQTVWNSLRLDDERGFRDTRYNDLLGYLTRPGPLRVATERTDGRVAILFPRYKEEFK